MGRAIVLVGNPLCGKTTYAHQCYGQRENLSIIQADTPVSDLLFPCGFYEEMVAAMKKKDFIIVDGINHTVAKRKSILEQLDRFHYEVDAVLFDYRLRDYTRLGRYRERLISGDKTAIKRFSMIRRQMEKPCRDEGFEHIMVVKEPISIPIAKDVKAGFFQIASLLTSSKGDFFPTSVDEVRINTSTQMKLRWLERKGYQLIGVGNHHPNMSEEAFQDILIQGMRKVKANIKDILYCPHGAAVRCNCLMPRTGLAYEAMRRHHISLFDSLMIGSTNDDRRFCNHSQIGRFVDVTEMLTLLVDDELASRAASVT